MAVHTFTLVLDQQPTVGQMDKLALVRLGVATFGHEQGRAVVDVDFDGPTFADALTFAITDLTVAGGLTVLEVLDLDSRTDPAATATTALANLVLRALPLIGEVGHPDALLGLLDERCAVRTSYLS